MAKLRKSKLAFLDPHEILSDSISALDSSASHEGKIERPIERLYSFIFLLFICGGIFYLVSRAVWLELGEGENFFSKSLLLKSL